MTVQHWDEKRDGPLNENALTDKLAKSGYSVSTYVYPPGTYFPDHTHNVDKIDAVLSGTFEINMNNASYRLMAGDYIKIPRHTLHSAKVIGGVPVTSLDAVKLK